MKIWPRLNSIANLYPATHTTILFLLAGCFIAIQIGCATHSNRITKLRSSFYDGNLDFAESESQKLLLKNKKEKELIKLDQSLLRLAQGKPEEAENILREVRDRFKSGKPLDDFSNLSSWVLDDQNRAYQPDDYEQLFIQVFLALSNLVQNGDDAYAYVNQITALQNQIEAKIASSNSAAQNDEPNTPTEGVGSANTNVSKTQTASSTTELKSFQRVALAPYIAGILYEQTHRDYDSASRYYKKTIELNPLFSAASADLHRSENGTHSQKGNGVIYVFAAIGKGPVKVESAEVPTSQALLLADRILSATGKHTLPPTIAPIKISRVVIPPNEIQSVDVRVNDQLAGATETITDLGQIAKQQGDAKLNSEIARAVVRRIVKKSAIYASKDALGTTSNGWADILLNVGGVIWEATESADTRCWGLLPEKIQVLRIEVSAGQHQITLTSDNGGQPYSTTVEVTDARNSYIYANFPTKELAGEILVSN